MGLKFAAAMLFSCNLYALAPPPINFTREVVEVDGVLIEVTNENGEIHIKEINPVDHYGWQMTCLVAFGIFTIILFGWAYFLMPYYLLGYTMTYTSGLVIFSLAALTCILLANSSDNRIYKRPGPGEPCRMTVNLKASKEAVIAYEIYWDEKRGRWMGEMQGEKGPEVFHIAQMPGANSEVYPTDWAR